MIETTENFTTNKKPLFLQARGNFGIHFPQPLRGMELAVKSKSVEKIQQR